MKNEPSLSFEYSSILSLILSLVFVFLLSIIILVFLFLLSVSHLLHSPIFPSGLCQLALFICLSLNFHIRLQRSFSTSFCALISHILSHIFIP
jgi:hypothetical protein